MPRATLPFASWVDVSPAKLALPVKVDASRSTPAMFESHPLSDKLLPSKNRLWSPYRVVFTGREAKNDWLSLTPDDASGLPDAEGRAVPLAT